MPVYVLILIESILKRSKLKKITLLTSVLLLLWTHFSVCVNVHLYEFSLLRFKALIFCGFDKIKGIVKK